MSAAPHHPDPARRRAWVALVTMCLLALLGPVMGAQQALARPPYDLPGELVDEAGVLTDPAAVRRAQDRLQEETGLQLFVVYVDSFDGRSGPDWATSTARESGMGPQDLLLAVAVQDRRYGTAVHPGSGISERQRTDVESRLVESRLRVDDWQGAAIAAADGYREASLDQGNPWTQWWAWLLYGVGGWGLFAGVRRWRRARAEARTREEQRGQRHEQSLALGTAQVALDDALAASEHELSYAEAEFDRSLTEPFRAALEASRAEALEGYRGRTKLGDVDQVRDHGATLQELRTLLALVQGASARLDEHAQAFNELRALKDRAPERIAELAEETGTARRQLADLSRLVSARTDLEPGTAARFATTVERIGGLVDAAQQAVAQAGELVEQSRPQDAVLPIRAAEDLVQQAHAQMEPLRDIDQIVASWQRALEQARASLSSDVEDADQIAADLPEVQALAGRARELLDRTRPGPRLDPVQAAQELGDLERELDAALDPRRDEVKRFARATSRATAQLSRSSQQLKRLQAEISESRDAAGAEVRRRRVQAGDLITQAHGLLETTPQEAEKLARQAGRIISVARDQLESARQQDRRQAQSSGWGWGAGASSSSWSSSSSSSFSSSSFSSSSSSSSGGSHTGGGGRF